MRLGRMTGKVVGKPKLVEGKHGMGLEFSGQIDSVSFDNEGFPAGNSAMTWSAWFLREVGDNNSVQYIADVWHCGLLRPILRNRHPK